MTIDTDAPGAGDLMLVLILLAPLVLVVGGGGWIVGATIARGSLERWPRLLVHTPGQYRRLRAWVMFVPILGPLTYGAAWCIGRAQLDPLRKAEARSPFSPPQWEDDASRRPESAWMQGAQPGSWLPTPHASFGAAIPGSAPPSTDPMRATQRPPYGWPSR